MEKLRALLEAAFLSLVLFRVLTLLFVAVFESQGILFYVSILFTHYVTVLLCGFWCGWRIRVDGWLYGIGAYFLFYMLRQLFDIYYPLPLSTVFKLLLLIPLLALLLVGAVYGEIAAERKEEEKRPPDMAF